MARSGYDDWFTIGMGSWLLGTEAATVIALRSAKLALGGEAAWREAHLMVEEKSDACMALGIALATGQMGTRPDTIARSTVAHYRRRVRANRSRLTGRKAARG